LGGKAGGKSQQVRAFAISRTKDCVAEKKAKEKILGGGNSREGKRQGAVILDDHKRKKDGWAKIKRKRMKLAGDLRRQTMGGRELSITTQN